VPAMALAVVISCGGAPEQGQEQRTEAAVEVSAAAKEFTLNDPDLPLKPLPLPENRYIEEQVQEELEIAYQRQLGDYIDPRQVREMLEKRRQVQDVQPEPAAKTVRGWPISYQSHEEARKLFDEGNIAAAAARWADLPSDKRAFTISVEVDCSAAVLKQTYAALSELEAPVFVLKESVGNDVCYRLCLGIFSTKSEAQEWMPNVRTIVPGSYPFAVLVARTAE
jgi:hypothetical protein